ncbi:MAG: UV DNA damage repair endonuclease UvsE [Candidatus Hodarchaeota archaeon]
MKIGYPCINLSLKCRSSRTFRLKNYSEKRLIATIESNLKCLQQILNYNRERCILFFRITSDLIPFASHPIMKFDWQDYFKLKFREISKYIKQNNMRITMHPGQYTVLNSKNLRVVANSIKELQYHANVLDLLGLDLTAKIMTHIGGVYGDKSASIKRFKKIYKTLESPIKRRYVIENDDKSYNLSDCAKISETEGIPLVLDVYHHECFNSGLSLSNAFELCLHSWKDIDGIPIVHYSSQHPTKGKPTHADNIDLNHFNEFIKMTKNFDFDLMLEIKDKEQSALQAIKFVKNDSRFSKLNQSIHYIKI